MSKQGLLIACTGLLGGALASVAYQAGTARATVPVAANRLFYSGQLLNGAGALTGAHAVQVEFFSAATNGLSVCGPFMANSNPINGQFTINTSGCDDDFKTAANVFVQLTVDPGTANAILIPPALSSRPRVGSVPFATQAERSDVSDAVSGDIPATQITSGATTAEARLNDLTTRLNKVESRTRATGFCGETAQAFTGDLGGFLGADTKCRAACGNSTTAHMCSTQEMVTSSRRGVTIPDADNWVISGTGVFQGAALTGPNAGQPSNTSQLLDCIGFTLGNNPIVLGATWSISGGAAVSGPSQRVCTSQTKVWCCDFLSD